MSIIMALWVLLGFGQNTALTPEEMETKAHNERCYAVQQHLNSVGQGETWRNSMPEPFSNDTSLERNA